MKQVKVDGGYCIHGDSTIPGVRASVRQLTGDVALIVADPPYGNIVSDKWDQVNTDDRTFVDWMLEWTRSWGSMLHDGGAMYVWGGLGKVGFRPFFRYLHEAEQPGEFELSTLITWSKRRAYGTATAYLFTREECAFFIKGNAKKPRCFNIPLLETKRGYAGYNAAYPAKSEFFRRTNVWTDINEIFKGKVHTAQKQQRLHEIMIEVHTQPGEYVVDPFAGSGTTAHAARKLDRKFVVIEKDETEFEKMLARLR